MTTRAVVLIALLSALIGGLLTGWIIDRRGSRERARLVEESAALRQTADSLDRVRREAEARADSSSAEALRVIARSDSATARARSLTHRVAVLDSAVAQAATVRDSVDRLVELAAGLRAERGEWESAATTARVAWDQEREANARLRGALAASDSARAVDRVRIQGLERAAALTRRSESRWLGLIPVPSRGLVFVAGALVGGYVMSR